MASTLGHLFQDQNLIVHSDGASLVGKNDAKKTQRKAGLGGRKPLGDVSNSEKPALSNASKKKPSKDITHDASNKKGFSKASEKVQTRSRKALSDISNSQTPDLQNKHNMKLNVVAEEEPLCPGSIADEGFLHNHEECIKAQDKAMDIDQFLISIGLLDDPSKKLTSQWDALPLSSKLEPERAPKYLDLEEMPEHERSWLSDKLDSPPPCKSPKSPNWYSDSPLFREDCDFQLAKTP